MSDTQATTRSEASVRCSCAHHSDGSVTTFLCPLHAKDDPCLTMASVTGKRRHGSIVRGVCSACGWSAKRTAPTCPQHGLMVERPAAAQTTEQKWCGTWFDCVEHRCNRSTLLPSEALRVQANA